MDLSNSLVVRDIVRARSFCISFFFGLAEHKRSYSFTCSVGENYSAANLLVCVTRVYAQTNMQLDSFIELCLCGLANKVKSLTGLVNLCRINELCALIILLSVFH